MYGVHWSNPWSKLIVSEKKNNETLARWSDYYHLFKLAYIT